MLVLVLCSHMLPLLLTCADAGVSFVLADAACVVDVC